MSSPWSLCVFFVTVDRMNISFLRSRIFWAGLSAIVAVGGYILWKSQFDRGPFYETERVTRGDVIRTVEVTGQIKPEQRINLSFRGSGRLGALHAKVGQVVVPGHVLAELENTDVRFATERAGSALAVARANLAAREAGETEEAIRIAQAALEQAEAALKKAQSDLEIVRLQVEDDARVAELAGDTANKNFANATRSTRQTVLNSYDTARNAFFTALGAVQTGLVDGDVIIGVDNSAANDAYENMLGLYDRSSLDQARNAYPDAKASRQSAERSVRSLTAQSSPEDIRIAASAMRSALQKTQSFLDATQRALAGTATGVNLNVTDLGTKKTLIETDRSAVSTQLAAVIAAEQGMTTAELAQTSTLDQMRNAAETAQANLTIARHNRETKVKSAETNVVLQRAALESAKASLSLKQSRPRAVDLGALRAQIQEAATAYAEATEKLKDLQIIVRTTGTVAEILPSLGEQVLPNVTVIKMIGSDGITVETLIPEADIAKVIPGQIVRMTLDAYGDAVAFTGAVLSEDPDQTKVQDAVYYKAFVTLEPAGHDVKPGMTANVTILTGERKNVLFIPSRALREERGRLFVRIGEQATRDVPVTIGLRGNEGRVEVLSGVSEGETIVVGELTKEEYAKRK